MTHKTSIFLLALGLVLSGCVLEPDEFQTAIEKAKNQSSIAKVEPAQNSLPYFATKTLTPTWNKNEGTQVPSIKLIDHNGANFQQLSRPAGN